MALALRRTGMNVTLFQGAPGGAEPWRRPLPCLRRFQPSTRRLHSVTRRLGGWRYGCGSEYEIEQSTFAASLWRAIHRDFDLLHVQDYRVARTLDALHRIGRSRPRVIFGNGTEESQSDLQKLSCVQHLAPYHQQVFEPYRPAGQLSFAVPCFVDTDSFRPGNRTDARAGWGLPQHALIILSVAALKNTHKRCDYLIREFAAFRQTFSAPSLLVLAGARENETPEVAELGKSLLGDSFLMLESVDRPRILSLYRAADIFALASLYEMLGIVVLEAGACGLPVTCSNTAVLAWAAGPASRLEDISVPGGFVRQWMRLVDPDARNATGAQARIHVETTFSEPVVLKQVQDMYASVMAQSQQ